MKKQMHKDARDLAWHLFVAVLAVVTLWFTLDTLWPDVL